MAATIPERHSLARYAACKAVAQMALQVRLLLSPPLDGRAVGDAPTDAYSRVGAGPSPRQIPDR